MKLSLEWLHKLSQKHVWETISGGRNCRFIIKSKPDQISSANDS